MIEPKIAIRSRAGMPKEAILLTIDFKEYFGQWLAECLELGTATQADSLEEVRQEIWENITLQLESVEELGFMEEYLKQRNVPLLCLEPPSGAPREAAIWASPTLAGV